MNQKNIPDLKDLKKLVLSEVEAKGKNHRLQILYLNSTAISCHATKGLTSTLRTRLLSQAIAKKMTLNFSVNVLRPIGRNGSHYLKVNIIV